MTERDIDFTVDLDRFIEVATAAASKRRQAPLQKKYITAIRKRFAAQGKWFVKEILPHLRARIAESLREASDKPLSVAEILEFIAKALNELKAHPDDPKLVTELDSLLSLAYATGIKDSLVDLETEIGFNLESTAAIHYLETNTFSNLAKTLDETTAAEIEKILAAGLEDGLSYSQIAKLISQKFADFGAARARLIAITEIGNAYSDATLQTALQLEQAGVSMEKAWMTVGDERVDPDCLANEAAEWISAAASFPSGDERPLAHPGCRCALLVRRAKVETPEPVLVA
jgi:Phage Mu protein F like protein